MTALEQENGSGQDGVQEGVKDRVCRTWGFRFLLCCASFLIVSGIALLAFYKIGLEPFGTKTVTIDDAKIQYIDFFTYYVDVLHGTRSLTYDFANMLGGNSIGLFGYYLASPFNLLLYFFGKEGVYRFFDLAVILKLGTAGAVFAWYLQRRFQDRIRPAFVLALSMGYGLMQYTVAQSANIMWLDGVFMLPLILLGVYEVLHKKSVWRLALAVAFCIYCNWYIAGVSCLFSGVWFLFEYFFQEGTSENGSAGSGSAGRHPGARISRAVRGQTKESGWFVRFSDFFVSFCRYVWGMGLGVALSAMLFLPVISAMRHGTGQYDEIEFLMKMRGDLLSAVRGYVIGTESAHGFAALFCGGIAIPAAAALLFSGGFRIRQKISVVVLAGFCFLMLHWEPAMLAFSLLKRADSYWYRYSYLVCFTLLFCAGAYLSRAEKDRWSKGFMIAASLLFAAALLKLNGVHVGNLRVQGLELVYAHWTVFATAGASVALAVLTAFLLSGREDPVGEMLPAGKTLLVGETRPAEETLSAGKTLPVGETLPAGSREAAGKNDLAGEGGAAGNSLPDGEGDEGQENTAGKTTEKGKDGRGKRPVRAAAALLLLGITAAELWANAWLLWQKNTDDSQTLYLEYSRGLQAQLAQLRAVDSGYYRIAQDRTRWHFEDDLTAYLNESLAQGYWSNVSYTSSQDERQFSLMWRLGYRDEAGRIMIVRDPMLASDSFLGVKYMLQSTPVEGLEPVEEVAPFNGRSAYRNPFALPMAFVYDGAKLPVRRYENTYVYQNALFSVLYGKKTDLYTPLVWTLHNEGNKSFFSVYVPKKAEGSRYENLAYGNLLWASKKTGLMSINGAAPFGYCRWLSPASFLIRSRQEQAQSGAGESLQAAGRGEGILSGRESELQEAAAAFDREALTSLDESKYADIRTLVFASDEGLSFKDYQFYSLDLNVLQEAVERIREGEVTDVKIENGHVTCSLEGVTGRSLCLLVPYSKGWEAFRNGEPVQPDTVAGTMITIPLVNGRNEIELTYHIPYLREGICVSAAALAALLIDALCRWRAGRGKK